MSTVDLSACRGTVRRVTEEVGQGTVEAWMTEHGPSVLRLAYAFLMDRHQAEDVCQEVFVKAHHYASRLQDSARVRQWLLQTTANRCRDIRRSRWWRMLALGRWTAQPDGRSEGEALTHVADSDPEVDPAAAVAKSEAKETVARAVWTLPAGYRETVALYYFEGLTAMEVARLTGVREGTVHSRLHRARQLLKAKLDEWGVEP